MGDGERNGAREQEPKEGRLWGDHGEGELCWVDLEFGLGGLDGMGCVSPLAVRRRGRGTAGSHVIPFPVQGGRPPRYVSGPILECLAH